MGLSKIRESSNLQSRFFKKKYLDLLTRQKPNIIISGISYHNDGIDSDVFKEKKDMLAYNFALRGQDIYYDFEIAKLLDSMNYLEKVKYYIIGLCYYSFELDLSKTNNAWEIIRYYPYIKKTHNFIDDELIEDYVYEKEKELQANEVYYRLFSKRNACIIDFKEGENVAKVDFNKNYPLSVWENKKILRCFIDYLLKREIKPIIVIMPAVKGYVDGCPVDFKKRFYSALNESLEGIDIQVLDYFGRYYGDETDYYHVSHFNAEGARKFTNKLIEDIDF